MDNERRPESEDALEALDAVVSTPPARRKKNFFEKNMIPLKWDSKQTRRRKIIFDVCLVIILISALVLLWVTVIDPMRADRLSDELKSLNDGNEVVTTQEDSSEDGEETTRNVKTVRLSAEKLLAINSDYIGWLRAPGGVIDQPIVQTGNNNYYLYRDFKRNSSKYGNPFLDYRCKMDPMSTNLIIYGHHMANGSIFSKLTRYKQVDVVRKNPLITLEMPDGTTYQYKIVSVLAINGNPEDDNGYVFEVNTPEFPGKESFDGYVKQLKERSYVNTGIDVEYGDKLIALQTCIYDFDYEYLYVVGRLVRDGESTSVDTTQIKKNPNPRLPQKLCDKLGIKNSYAAAERWSAPR